MLAQPYQGNVMNFLLKNEGWLRDFVVVFSLAMLCSFGSFFLGLYIGEKDTAMKELVGEACVKHAIGRGHITG
jgi:hypothetical protein